MREEGRDGPREGATDGWRKEGRYGGGGGGGGREREGGREEEREGRMNGRGRKEGTDGGS